MHISELRVNGNFSYLSSNSVTTTIKRLSYTARSEFDAGK